MTKIYLTIAIVGLVVGIAMHANPIASGMGKAMFGVFFIVAFLVKLAEVLDLRTPRSHT